MLNALSFFSFCSLMINMDEMLIFDKLCTKLNLWKSKGMIGIDYVNHNRKHDLQKETMNLGIALINESRYLGGCDGF